MSHVVSVSLVGHAWKRGRRVPGWAEVRLADGRLLRVAEEHSGGFNKVLDWCDQQGHDTTDFRWRLDAWVKTGIMPPASQEQRKSGAKPGSETMYYTICKCPVCGQELDTLSHPAPEPSGQATAMLIQPLRREHAEQSPACTQDERWYQGWTKETFPGPLSERNTPSEP